MWPTRVVALVAVMFLPLLYWVGAADEAKAAGPRSIVTDIRVGLHQQVTRFVMDIFGASSADIFTLENPYRIVIDLPQVGWRLPPRPLPAEKGLFKKVRYGLFKPGTTRVVIETTGPAAVSQAMFLAPAADGNQRLVLDFAPSTPQAFRQAMKAETSKQTISSAAVAGPPGNAAAGGADDVADGQTLATASLPFVRPPRKPHVSLKKPLIVLDPGHGGVDPGAIGASGTYEKHITLSAGREFRRMFEATGRYRVLMTRERDIFIPLRERVSFAREAGADLFISIHADTVKRANVRGLSVYTLSEKASDREAAQLAESENKSDLIAGMDLSHETPEVTNILIDLAQRETMNQSARFASLTVGELRRNVRLLPNTHRFAGFRVLKAPDVPSVLVEMGFLSNKADERELKSKAYRAKLGKALVRAVDGYFANIEEAFRQ